jgi:hypothetical protein
MYSRKRATPDEIYEVKVMAYERRIASQTSRKRERERERFSFISFDCNLFAEVTSFERLSFS